MLSSPLFDRGKVAYDTAMILEAIISNYTVYTRQYVPQGTVYHKLYSLMNSIVLHLAESHQLLPTIDGVWRVRAQRTDFLSLTGLTHLTINLIAWNIQAEKHTGYSLLCVRRQLFSPRRSRVNFAERRLSPINQTIMTQLCSPMPPGGGTRGW